jgi:DNA modification methylase
VTDRPTKAHEYIFLLTKSPHYYYDADAIREPAHDWGVRDRTNGKYHNEGTGLTPHSGLINSDFAQLGRNKRSVWEITVQGYSEAHFATFPEALVKPCILAGTKEQDTVLDPFAGSGTAMQVAQGFGRNSIGVELNDEYIDLAVKRLERIPLPMKGMI